MGCLRLTLEVHVGDDEVGEVAFHELSLASAELYEASLHSNLVASSFLV